MHFVYLFLLFIFLLLLAPLLITFIVVYWGLDFLSFSLPAVLLFLFAMLIASFINIPLGGKRFVKIVEPSFLGMGRRAVWRSQGLSINLGGALIPLMIVGYILPRLAIEPLLVGVLVVSFFSFLGAKFIKDKGIMISMTLPVLFAVLFGLMLAPEHAAEFAFSAGVLGVLIGADLLHLPMALKKGGGAMSIGGAGIFDGIFLVGVVSALLAGL